MSVNLIDAKKARELSRTPSYSKQLDSLVAVLNEQIKLAANNGCFNLNFSVEERFKKDVVELCRDGGFEVYLIEEGDLCIYW